MTLLHTKHSCVYIHVTGGLVWVRFSQYLSSICTTSHHLRMWSKLDSEYSHKEGCRCCRCWPPLEGGWPARKKQHTGWNMSFQSWRASGRLPLTRLMFWYSMLNASATDYHCGTAGYTAWHTAQSFYQPVLMYEPANLTATEQLWCCIPHYVSTTTSLSVLFDCIINLVRSKAAAAVDFRFLLLHTQAPPRPNLHLINQPLHTLFIPLSEHSLLATAASLALVFPWKPEVRKFIQKIIWSCSPVLKPRNWCHRSAEAKWRDRPDYTKSKGNRAEIASMPLR